MLATITHRTARRISRLRVLHHRRVACRIPRCQWKSLRMSRSLDQCMLEGRSRDVACSTYKLIQLLLFSWLLPSSVVSLLREHCNRGTLLPLNNRSLIPVATGTHACATRNGTRTHSHFNSDFNTFDTCLVIVNSRFLFSKVTEQMELCSYL